MKFRFRRVFQNGRYEILAKDGSTQIVCDIHNVIVRCNESTLPPFYVGDERSISLEKQRRDTLSVSEKRKRRKRRKKTDGTRRCFD